MLFLMALSVLDFGWGANVRAMLMGIGSDRMSRIARSESSLPKSRMWRTFTWWPGMMILRRSSRSSSGYAAQVGAR